MSAVRGITEAALAKEDSIELAVAEMQKVIVALQQAERAVQAQQKALPNFVALEVDRKLDQTVAKATAQISARFTASHEAAERARKTFDEASERARHTYEKAEDSLTRNVIRNSFIYFTVGCLGMILGVWACAHLFVPPADILQRQREAERAVAILAPQGGKSVLSYCGQRRCVRTDEATQNSLWSDTKDLSVTYRIIYGY
ncbi:hypothetical protein [Rhodopila sp.]|uniref:hypothetical protein n=1 Tax=Rhodopila sp. TaxID=2480087 RepID=UPI003D0DAFC2